MITTGLEVRTGKVYFTSLTSLPFPVDLGDKVEADGAFSACLCKIWHRNWPLVFFFWCLCEADEMKWRGESSGSDSAGGIMHQVLLLTGAVTADGFSCAGGHRRCHHKNFLSNYPEKLARPASLTAEKRKRSDSSLLVMARAPYQTEDTRYSAGVSIAAVLSPQCALLLLFSLNEWWTHESDARYQRLSEYENYGPRQRGLKRRTWFIRYNGFHSAMLQSRDTRVFAERSLHPLRLVHLIGPLNDMVGYKWNTP